MDSRNTRSTRFGSSDIFEGSVAYFAVTKLNTNSDVVKPPSPPDRDGPFLCIEADANRSCWIEVTSQGGRDRVEIPVNERKGGSQRWRSGPQFINALDSTYVGPDAGFVQAALKEDPLVGADRPCVSLAFVSTLLGKCRAAGAATLSASDPLGPPDEVGPA